MTVVAWGTFEKEGVERRSKKDRTVVDVYEDYCYYSVDP